MSALSRPNPIATVGMVSFSANLHSLKQRASFIGWNAARLSRLVRRNTFVDHILIFPRIEWMPLSLDRSLGLALHRSNAVAITTPQHANEWPVERPLPKNLIASVEKSDPCLTVKLNEDRSGQCIGGTKFSTAIVPTTTVGSRESPKTSIHAPVGPPTLAVSHQSPHVLGPTDVAAATHTD
jgi:hypothetical protein